MIMIALNRVGTVPKEMEIQGNAPWENGSRSIATQLRPCSCNAEDQHPSEALFRCIVLILQFIVLSFQDLLP